MLLEQSAKHILLQKDFRADQVLPLSESFCADVYSRVLWREGKQNNGKKLKAVRKRNR